LRRREIIFSKENDGDEDALDNNGGIGWGRNVALWSFGGRDCGQVGG
jgi:hypothetical protein